MISEFKKGDIVKYTYFDGSNYITHVVEKGRNYDSYVIDKGSFFNRNVTIPHYTLHKVSKLEEALYKMKSNEEITLQNESE